MAIPANSILQLSFLGAYAGQRVLHTRTFQLTEGGEGAATAAQITAEFLAGVNIAGADDKVTNYIACLTSGYTIQLAQAQIVYPTRYAYQRTAVGLGIPGTRGATSTGLLDCVITMQTALSGRDQVSNFKMGPAPATDFTNGTLGADITGALNAYKNNMLESVTTAVGLTNWDPGIWHRTVPGPTVFFDRFVTGYVQDTARAKTTRTVRRGE